MNEEVRLSTQRKRWLVNVPLDYHGGFEAQELGDEMLEEAIVFEGTEDELASLQAKVDAVKDRHMVAITEAEENRDKAEAEVERLYDLCSQELNTVVDQSIAAARQVSE